VARRVTHSVRHALQLVFKLAPRGTAVRRSGAIVGFRVVAVLNQHLPVCEQACLLYDSYKTAPVWVGVRASLAGGGSISGSRPAAGGVCNGGHRVCGRRCTTAQRHGRLSAVHACMSPGDGRDARRSWKRAVHRCECPRCTARRLRVHTPRRPARDSLRDTTDTPTTACATRHPQRRANSSRPAQPAPPATTQPCSHAPRHTHTHHATRRPAAHRRQPAAATAAPAEQRRGQR